MFRRAECVQHALFSYECPHLSRANMIGLRVREPFVQLRAVLFIIFEFIHLCVLASAQVSGHHEPFLSVKESSIPIDNRFVLVAMMKK